ncbi:cellulose biosynthesis protein BcsN [Mesorhizobium sp. BR1-1-16]|uniref:cellulose biosynthesis protein BcsN n=1 Tax=Mesorhizobium sp. BR1-1-16 TaxID=2876653 RepID=UPI001CCC2A22|nr:cellulose biosynthesis protein BcsN [Mesorhizobium sp. BR1-1-16]MBZ9937481.1 cellulose biosynthesis protein BcsN [Mesorhizobium sp. BR1-1-16]
MGPTMRRTATAASWAQEQGGGAVRGFLAVCLGASVLGACAAKPQDIISSSMALRQPAEKAMVDMPPGGPAVLGVVQRTYSNATTQEITLENRARNSGENKLTITMFGPVVQVTAPENKLNNDPLALLNVSREFGWFFPGVKMQVSNYYTQNRYGSFGYATGRSTTGDTCLYAWQRIRQPDLDSTLISRQGTIIIRLRLCEPRASEIELLNVMTGFTINAYFLSSRWNPYGSVPPPPEDLGKPGVSVLPPASAYLAPDAVVPQTPVRRAIAVSETPIPVETIAPDAVVVPSPSVAPVTTSSIVSPNSTATTDPTAAVPLDGYPVVPSP